jgi:hypothetical protein
MSIRRGGPVVFAVLVLGLTACGGGKSGAKNLALGQEAVVQNTQIASGGTPERTTTLAVTVLHVRKGTQEELKKGGFSLDPDQKTATPYYVDVRYANRGQATIKRQFDVSLEDKDGNLITATTIIDLGGTPFAKCPRIYEGDLAPGQKYESCSLFLVPKGKDPARVSFLPYNPKKETSFVYWNTA